MTSSGCLVPEGAPDPSALCPSLQGPALLAGMAGLSHCPCHPSGRLCSQGPTRSCPWCRPPATFVTPSPRKAQLLTLLSSGLTTSLLLTCEVLWDRCVDLPVWVHPLEGQDIGPTAHCCGPNPWHTVGTHETQNLLTERRTLSVHHLLLIYPRELSDMSVPSLQSQHPRSSLPDSELQLCPRCLLLNSVDSLPVTAPLRRITRLTLSGRAGQPYLP